MHGRNRHSSSVGSAHLTTPKYWPELVDPRPLLLYQAAMPVFRSLLRMATQLHPGFPVVEGKYEMTDEWSITLPSKFNRRFEDGQLVIWQPKMTLWVVIWGQESSKKTIAERLNAIKRRRSPNAEEESEERLAGSLLYTYRLREESDDERVRSFNCFALGEKSEVQLSIYFDAESQAKTAMEIARSLSYQN